MPPLTLTFHLSVLRSLTDGGEIVGNASKRCNAGAVTLGSVTHYGAVLRAVCGSGITPPGHLGNKTNYSYLARTATLAQWSR